MRKSGFFVVLAAVIGVLAFAAAGCGGDYDGDLKDGQLTGTWTQGPGTLPLTFKRAAK